MVSMAFREGWFRRLFPGGWSSAAAIGALAVFAIGYWMFGGISRADLDILLQVSVKIGRTTEAWRDDGTVQAIGRASVVNMGEVGCEHHSGRRSATTHYKCLYAFTDASGQRLRVVLAMDHNRGFARTGIADVGDYRYIDLSDEEERALLARLGD